MNYQEELRYVGDISQVFGIRPFIYSNGKADGLHAVDVKTKDLNFVVTTGKCLDIPSLSYKGINLAFQSKAGLTNPSYYNEDGTRGFLRCFNAGMLTTCGLSSMGSPSVDENQAYGLHGNIHNAGAEDVASYIDYNGTPKIILRGRMREAEVFGNFLTLERTISCNYNENKFTISDKVTNNNPTESPLMLLYHINFGYPMLSEYTQIEIPHTKIISRNNGLLKEWETINQFAPPKDICPEQCFFFDVLKDENGMAEYKVINKKLGLCVRVSYNADAMPYLTLWKSMAAKDYALGIEPGTYWPNGRAEARSSGNLLYIKGGETKVFGFEFEAYDL